MTYNSCKSNGWCNNHSHKYFAGNQLSKPHHSSDPHRLWYIKYQIAIAQSTPITPIIVFYCCYLCLLNSRLYLFSITCLCSAFKQSIMICMCMCTHGHQMMVTETNKTTNFYASFFYNMFLYWKVIPLIGITFFCWQVLFRQAG